MRLLAFFLCLCFGLHVAQYVTLSEGPCLANVSVNRHGWSSQSGPMIILDGSAWDSNRLASKIFAVLVNEVLGYPIEYREYSGSGATYERLNSGVTHINMECWPAGIRETVERMTREGQLVDMGSLGYIGRNGLFVPNYMVEARSDAAIEYWRAFQRRDVLDMFPPAGSLTPARLSDGSFLCGEEYECTNGSYIPPHCRSPNSGCIDVAYMFPWWTPFMANRMVDGLQLNMTLTYLGGDAEAMATEKLRLREPFLMYHWRPDGFTAKHTNELTRLTLPEHLSECHTGFDSNKSLPVKCDYKSNILKKFVWSGLEASAPAVAQLVSSMIISDTLIESMLAEVSRGSSVSSVACAWVKENVNEWSQWIPPKTPPGWTCSSLKYGKGDGCDCSCGIVDPDCLVSSVPLRNCDVDAAWCDWCGECDGDNSTCTGCDGVLHSGMVEDACGTCGGDGNCADDAGTWTVPAAIVGVLAALALTVVGVMVYAGYQRYLRKHTDTKKLGATTKLKMLLGGEAAFDGAYMLLELSDITSDIIVGVVLLQDGSESTLTMAYWLILVPAMICSVVGMLHYVGVIGHICQEIRGVVYDKGMSYEVSDMTTSRDLSDPHVKILAIDRAIRLDLVTFVMVLVEDIPLMAINMAYISKKNVVLAFTPLVFSLAWSVMAIGFRVSIIKELALLLDKRGVVKAEIKHNMMDVEEDFDEDFDEDFNEDFNDEQGREESDISHELLLTSETEGSVYDAMWTDSSDMP